MAILKELSEIGQSIWLDNINRKMFTDGSLKKLIDQGLRGMTSNPSIFMNAIAKSTDYDERILALKGQGASAFEIYDELTVKDVQDAADQFLSVYEETDGLDGYVSLEINPKLANEDDAQFQEGVRLWKKVARPNVMIKVPATKNGIKVVTKLLAQGINVNVTLIFSIEQYHEVVQAYIRGLKKLGANDGYLSRTRSVASFFVSRIDATVDALLDKMIVDAPDESVKNVLESLKGRAAVANCELAYELFEDEFVTEAFEALKKKGAHVQRLLWASTSTKNPSYSDVKYVQELIADPTVNTLPTNTLEAVLDHGRAVQALPHNANEAQNIVDELKINDIDLTAVCEQLLAAGVDAFIASFDDLLASIEQKAQALNL